MLPYRRRYRSARKFSWHGAGIVPASPTLMPGFVPSRQGSRGTGHRQIQSRRIGRR